MRIHGLTTCVNYADKLKHGIGNWLPALTSLTIVTSAQDNETNLLAEQYGANVVNTHAFWINDNGVRDSMFNKSRAMMVGIEHMPWEAWILFFDADVSPQSGWLQQVEAFEPRCGNLYGAQRMLDDGTVKREGEIAGFFQMFHVNDPVVQAKPLLTSHTNASGYDSIFQSRWPRENRIVMPLVLRHFGPHGQHWCGIHNDAAMDALRQERKRRGGWQHEVIQ